MSLLTIGVLFALVDVSLQWRGHYVSYVKVKGHRYVRWCDYHCWWHCCSYSHRTETITEVAYRCAPMWTHSGNQNCNIPLCSTACTEREECVAKPSGAHVCQCKSGFVGAECDCPDGRTGPNCELFTCNYDKPCYPGDCHPGPTTATCNCQQNFKGLTCLQVPQDWEATISVTASRLSFWKRATANPKEEYALEIYSTEPNTTKWTNMKRFNWLNVSGTAMFNTETPLRPAYVSKSGFGITDAQVNIKLLKLPVEGALEGVLKEETRVCDVDISFNTPTNLVDCKINEPNFIWLLENGDRLTLEFIISAGGFRDLVNSRTGDFQRTDRYTENKVSTSVVYRFDSVSPSYSNKEDAFFTGSDFTKAPINLRWSGWVDGLSGMGRYTWEVFHLKPNGDGDLTEENKMRPITHHGVNHTNPIVYPLPYTPKQPGMYSIILEAVDKANNSVYMRRFVLYDPESSVTTDSKHQMRFSAAHLDKEGHQWVSAQTNQLRVTWTDYFVNYLHEKDKFLNRILKFSVQLVEGEDIYKRVDPENDDHEGGRTLDEVPNKRGILKFETAFVVHNSGDEVDEQALDWHKETNLTTTKVITKVNSSSGASLTFWVKAIDSLGNSKTDSTLVTFDFSEPITGIPDLHINQPSDVPFSSKLQLEMIDQESGVDHLRLKVIDLRNGYLLTNQTLEVETLQPKDCKDTSVCYCPKALSVCYKRVNDLYISNCWLMVSRDSLKTAQVRLVMDVVNRAGHSKTPPSNTVTDLMSLNGTEAYFGPMDVKVEKISQSGVRVTWHHAPSCYSRTFIWLSIDDSGKMIKIHKDAESYDLTDLEPGKAYTIKLQADYGGIKSKAVAVSFKTLDAPGVGAGTVAGIVIGVLLIITVLGVGFFLWRTGKGAALMRRGRRTIRRRNQSSGDQRVNNVLVTKNINSKKGIISFKNQTYAVDDDIYVYGSMEFGSEQPWYIPKNNLTLLDEMNSGRFARVYKASYKTGSLQEVAAKVLKDQPTEETMMLMMAKINFAATQVGQHRNVLGFIGAVLDNHALGPVLVMEYCENGQLDKWLTVRQRNVDMDVLEKLQTFVLQIARGMDYLTQKGVVHRKLAARNCLLTFPNEVKIAGFGPSKIDEQSEEDSGKGDRIPVKWTAPECLKSLRGANEKSDIWSFGVTMWEIFSMGQSPYAELRSRDLPMKIRNGHRLNRPEYAEDIHYDMMKDCWMVKPDQRPTFTMVLDKLETSFGLRPASGAVYYYSK